MGRNPNFRWKVLVEVCGSSVFRKKMVMEEKQCSKNRSVWPAKHNFYDIWWFSLVFPKSLAFFWMVLLLMRHVFCVISFAFGWIIIEFIYNDLTSLRGMMVRIPGNIPKAQDIWDNPIKTCLPGLSTRVAHHFPRYDWHRRSSLHQGARWPGKICLEQR